MFVKAIKKIFTSKKKSVEPVFATHHYDDILAYIDDLRKDPATGAPIPFTLNNGKKEFNSSTARVFPVARSEVRDAGTTSGPTPTSATKRPLPGPNIQTMSRPYRSPTNVTVVSPAITKNIRRVDTSNVKRFGGVPPAIASSIISNSKPTFTSSDSLAPSELAYMKETRKAIAPIPSVHQQTPRKRDGAVWWTVASPNTSSETRVLASEPELKESPKACPTLLPSSTPTAARKRRDGVVWSSAVPPTTSSDNRVAPPAIASTRVQPLGDLKTSSLRVKSPCCLKDNQSTIKNIEIKQTKFHLTHPSSHRTPLAGRVFFDGRRLEKVKVSLLSEPKVCFLRESFVHYVTGKSLFLTVVEAKGRKSLTSPPREDFGAGFFVGSEASFFLRFEFTKGPLPKGRSVALRSPALSDGEDVLSHVGVLELGWSDVESKFSDLSFTSYAASGEFVGV
ncbi:hypothetical protein L218DRAFT_986478 [Marasmius fiardii PR-910]|nr:hypothetical protein L218DRAFT_986478 [Marasmius fiardii PR-910]